MDFPNLGTNPELDDIMQRAKEFNIEDNLLDLVMYGFTVVPPEKMGASDLTPRLRDAILEVYERRSGHSIDNWKTYDGKLEKFQSWGWLLENDVFLEAIHNPCLPDHRPVSHRQERISGWCGGHPENAGSGKRWADTQRQSWYSFTLAQFRDLR